METCLGVGPGVEETSFLGKENWLNMMVVARMILSNLMLAGLDHMGRRTGCINPSAATFSFPTLHFTIPLLEQAPKIN